MPYQRSKSKDLNDDKVPEHDEEVKPAINDVDISNRIRKELFKQLGSKPLGFKRLEIKRISPPHSYRVNVVCSRQDDHYIIDTIYRPLSYYVVSLADGLVFSPEIIPIPST